MKVYKSTNKDMKCRGLQYEIGKAVEVDGVIELCKRGLHACEMPLDVLRYYAPGAGSRYFKADLSGVNDDFQKSIDTKRVGKKLILCEEIGISGLVKEQVEYVKEQVEYVKVQCDFDNAIKKANSEKESRATGRYGVTSATGRYGAASATGRYGAASATGEGCVALSTGGNGRVMGMIGDAVVCVERNDYGKIVAILSDIVDGETLKKSGVWYTVENGQWREVQ